LTPAGALAREEGGQDAERGEEASACKVREQVVRDHRAPIGGA
jgi:hypothetical protein